MHKRYAYMLVYKLVSGQNLTLGSTSRSGLANEHVISSLIAMQAFEGIPW